MQRSLCRLLRSQWESVPIQLGRHVVLATWQSFGTCKVFVECTVAWFRVPSIGVFQNATATMPVTLWGAIKPLELNAGEAIHKHVVAQHFPETPVVL